MNTKPLYGHRAVVTGASSGIGKEYARQLAALGSNLVIAARRIDRLEEIATELRSEFAIEVQCIQVDLCSPGASEYLYKKSLENPQPITILINNAGLGKYGSFMDFPYSDHQATLQVNTIAPTETTYLFVRHMLSHGKPSYITQVASVAAFQPVSNFTVYSGTKGYILAFSETLAFELRKTPIHVMCLCPGGTYTEFAEHAGQKITSTGRSAMMTSEEVVKIGISSMMKKKTIAVPGILNKLACFLPRFVPRNLSVYLTEKTMNRAVQKTHSKALNLL